MRSGVDFKLFVCNDVNIYISILKKNLFYSFVLIWFKKVFKSLLSLFCRFEVLDKIEKVKMFKFLFYIYDKEWYDEVRKWEYK